MTLNSIILMPLILLINILTLVILLLIKVILIYVVILFPAQYWLDFCSCAASLKWGHVSHLKIFFSQTVLTNFSTLNFHINFSTSLSISRQPIKKQRHCFANKDPSSPSFGFLSSHVWMWELDYKESWALKNWCFWTVVLEKTLESSLDCKEIQSVHLKWDQSWIFIGRTDAEAEAPLLWPHDVKNWLIWKDHDAGKDGRQEEKGTTEDEMSGWHHWLNGHEFE